MTNMDKFTNESIVRPIENGVEITIKTWFHPTAYPKAFKSHMTNIAEAIFQEMKILIEYSIVLNYHMEKYDSRGKYFETLVIIKQIKESINE